MMAITEEDLKEADEAEDNSGSEEVKTTFKLFSVKLLGFQTYFFLKLGRTWQHSC